MKPSAPLCLLGLYLKEGLNLVAARKSFPQGVTGGAPGVNQLCSSLQGGFSHSRTGSKRIGWLALVTYGCQSPGHSRPPPSTWPVTSDLGPVAKMGMGEVGALCLGQATDERVPLFALLTLLVRFWMLGTDRSPNPAAHRVV